MNGLAMNKSIPSQILFIKYGMALKKHIKAMTLTIFYSTITYKLTLAILFYFIILANSV